MLMVWPSATVLSSVPAATFGKVKLAPEEVIEAPGAAPALVSAVSEKLASLPSKLPGAVSLSAVIPTLLNVAARLEEVGAEPGRFRFTVFAIAWYAASCGCRWSQLS